MTHLQRFFRRGLAILLPAMLLLAACQPEARAVATVNGVAIPEERFRERMAFDSFLRANLEGTDPAAADRSRFLDQLLNTMIEEELVRQKAADMGLEASEDEIEARMQRLFQDVGGPNFARLAALTSEATGLPESRTSALWQEQAEGAVLVEELTLALDLPLSETVPVMHVHQIVVATQEEANAVVDRLEAGEDFADLAAELSLDESSADLGGDLGLLRASDMPVEFARATLALNVGQRALVQTNYGWHVVTISERLDEPITLEERRRQQDVLFQAELDSWWGAAEIEVDQAVMQEILAGDE